MLIKKKGRKKEGREKDGKTGSKEGNKYRKHATNDTMSLPPPPHKLKLHTTHFFF